MIRVVIFIGFFCITQFAMSASDSLQLEKKEMSKNESHLKKLYKEKCKRWDKELGIKCEEGSFSIDSNSIVWAKTDSDVCEIHATISYRDSCGKTSAEVEWHFILNSKTDKLEKKEAAAKQEIALMDLSKDYSLSAVGIYMPRCGCGERTTNDFNLIWIDANNKLIAIP